MAGQFRRDGRRIAWDQRDRTIPALAIAAATADPRLPGAEPIAVQATEIAEHDNGGSRIGPRIGVLPPGPAKGKVGCPFPLHRDLEIIAGIDPAQGPYQLVLIDPVRCQVPMAVDDDLDRLAPRFARTARQDLEEPAPAELVDDLIHVGLAAGSRELGHPAQSREDRGVRRQGRVNGGLRGVLGGLRRWTELATRDGRPMTRVRIRVPEGDDGLVRDRRRRFVDRGRDDRVPTGPIRSGGTGARGSIPRSRAMASCSSVPPASSARTRSTRPVRTSFMISPARTCAPRNSPLFRGSRPAGRPDRVPG